MDDHDDVLPPLRRSLPRAFRRWEVVVAPGVARPYDPTEWVGALVVVESGELDLICQQNTRTRLASGAVGFLADLPLRELRNAGETPVVLIAIARRPGRSHRADEFCPHPSSEPPNDATDPDSPTPRSPTP